MFQNITDEATLDDDEDVKLNSKTSKFDRMKELFSVQNILIYAISFMVSMVSFGLVEPRIIPFGLAIFAAVCSNRIAARNNI